MSEPPVDTWADPVAAADAAATSLLQLIDEDGDVGAAVAALRRRNSEALILALAEQVEGELPAVDVRRFREGLRDWRWLDRLAVEHAASASFGVVSLGRMTRGFLHAVAELASGVPEIRTHSRAVARGLGYLGFPTILSDPATAETVLVPAVARHRDRVWTTVKAGSAVRNAQRRQSRLLVLSHPLAVLSSQSRLAYRPEPIMIDVRIPTGVPT